MQNPHQLIELAEPYLPDTWYERAHASIAEAFGHLAGRTADLMAIMSPRRTVRASISAVLRYEASGTTRGLSASVRSALEWYESTGEIRGPKTSAFARNLRGDYNPVVIDVHMCRLLDVPHKSVGSRRRYEQCAHLVRECAALRGTTPASMQSALWHASYERTFPTGRPPQFDVLLREELERYETPLFDWSIHVQSDALHHARAVLRQAAAPQ